MSVRLTSNILHTSLLALVFSLPLLCADWRPLDPTDLALKQSKTDPNADAEALFREVHVLNEQRGFSYGKNVVTEYVRLKIFTDRSKEFANVHIPYFQESSIYNIEGRTIHPDGSIVELAKDSVFEKVLEKRGSKTKVVSFALPAVEVGSIIEYKYIKNEGEISYRYRQLDVQSAFPVHQVSFFIKPLGSGQGYPVMRYMPFGCQPEKGQTTNDGYDVITVRNVPAFYDEPYSPPEYSAKQWILIYYEENDKSGKDKYWTALGKELYRRYSEQMKVNGEIKQLAAEITQGAITDDAKLDKILTYCRTQLKDVRGDNITTAELDKSKSNRSSVDTIRRKEGTESDIQFAFLALAQAAGFDARRVELSDRATFLFGPVMQSAFFLNASEIAVSVGGNWKFYDVVNTAVPGGQLRWQEQGVYALVTDSKDPELIQTPMLTAAQSAHTRVGAFTLSEEGVLEGDVREILSGNHASEWREENRHTNEAQREDALRDQVKQRFADFDLSNVKITANANPSMPVGLTYHLVVRNYAQRTGKRLFVQPNYFAAGYGSRFPEATRHNNIYFEFPWSEVDNIDLMLPAGFELDNADAPTGVNAGATCKYDVKMYWDKQHHVLQYRRNLVFGNNQLLLFDNKIYPSLKKVFDTVHDADNRMLTLKVAAASPATGQ